MMAKSVGELVHAFADATVPKVNVIIGKAYGTAYVAMNSKAIGADYVYAWDNAEIGMMDASLRQRSCIPAKRLPSLTKRRRNTENSSQGWNPQRPEAMWIR